MKGCEGTCSPTAGNQAGQRGLSQHLDVCFLRAQWVRGIVTMNKKEKWPFPVGEPDSLRQVLFLSSALEKLEALKS